MRLMRLMSAASQRRSLSPAPHPAIPQNESSQDRFAALEATGIQGSASLEEILCIPPEERREIFGCKNQMLLHVATVLAKNEDEETGEVFQDGSATFENFFGDSIWRLAENYRDASLTSLHMSDVVKLQAEQARKEIGPKYVLTIPFDGDDEFLSSHGFENKQMLSPDQFRDFMTTTRTGKTIDRFLSEYGLKTQCIRVLAEDVENYSDNVYEADEQMGIDSSEVGDTRTYQLVFKTAPLDAEAAKNLDLAEQALQFIRDGIYNKRNGSFKSSNKVSEKKNLGDEQQRVQEASHELAALGFPPKDSSGRQYLNAAYLKKLETSRSHNCGHLARASTEYIAKRDATTSISLLAFSKPPTHSATLIGDMPPDAGANMRQWPAHLAICDPWANIACLAKDYPVVFAAKMAKWRSDKKLIGLPGGSTIKPDDSKWMDSILLGKKLVSRRAQMDNGEVSYEPARMIDGE